MPIIVGTPPPAPTTATSSDGYVTARLHTAWASVLVTTTMTGDRTLYRDGVAVGVFQPGGIAFYDHFPPLGGNVAYTVGSETLTSTPATVSVPIDPQHRTWIKSVVDPNLSVVVMQRTLDTVSHDNKAGVFPILPDSKTPAGTADTFVVYGGLASRRTTTMVTPTTIAARDNIEAMIGLGPIYWQPCPHLVEKPMWAVATKSQRKAVAVSALDWTNMTLDLVEHRAPAIRGDIIPGWGWRDVANTWATVDALKAAVPTVKALVEYGVT